MRDGRKFQFTLRGMLWAVVVVSLLATASRGGVFWATANTLLLLGGALLVNDSLSRTSARQPASQLLLGAVLIAGCCAAMFLAAYLRLVSATSGTLDYVTLALSLFASCFAVWILTAAKGAARVTSLAGYFAFIVGAYMLNHYLFDEVIRRLR